MHLALPQGVLLCHPGPVVAHVVAEDEPGALAYGDKLGGGDGGGGGDGRGLVDQVRGRPGVLCLPGGR